MIDLICITLLCIAGLVALKMHIKHQRDQRLLKDATAELRCGALYTIRCFGGDNIVGRCELQELHSGPHHIERLNGDERWWTQDHGGRP